MTRVGKAAICVIIMALGTGLVLALHAEQQKAGADETAALHNAGLNLDHPEAILGLLENPRICGTLGLTEAQKKKLKDQIAAHKKEMVQLRTDLEVAATEQARLLSEETTDLKDLMAIVEKSGRIRTDLAKSQMKKLVEVRAILTTEQRAKLKEMMRKFRDRRKEEGPGKNRGTEGSQAGDVRDHPKDAKGIHADHAAGGNASAQQSPTPAQPHPQP